MAKRLTWAEITETATSDEGMSAKNRFYFHYFNPNGAFASLREAQDEVASWCDRHPEQPNGVLFVYSSLNTYPDKCSDAALKAIRNRREVSWSCHYAVRMAREAEAKARAWLAKKAEEGLA